MSQENVEIVREFIKAWNAGDLAKAYETSHADMIMRMEGNWPEPGPHFGRDAVKSPSSTPSARARSASASSIGTTPRPSQPWACRSRALTPRSPVRGRRSFRRI